MEYKPLLVLVNLGTPDAPTAPALRRYLKEFLSDRRVVSLPPWFWQPLLRGVILPFRAPRSAAAYRAIWQEEGSPLLHYSSRLAEKLAQRLQGRVEVRLAMRYGQPDLAEALQQPAREVMLLPLYPQYSSTTTASVMDAYCQWASRRLELPNLVFVRDYHQHPAYIQALAGQIRQAWKTARGERLLFSFHGIPQRLADAGDPYAQQCRQTAEAVAGELGLESHQWQLVFQSRFGREAWLQPYANETLRALAKKGVASVDVICPGFAVDCLETLEEMAVENRDVFLQAGGQAYHYIPCLNDSEAQVALMAALWEAHAGEHKG